MIVNIFVLFYNSFMLDDILYILSVESNLKFADFFYNFLNVFFSSMSSIGLENLITEDILRSSGHSRISSERCKCADAVQFFFQFFIDVHHIF